MHRMKSQIKPFTPAAEYFFHEGCHIIELDNCVDNPALSIARARVEPGKTTRWHKLTNTVERYVIIEGSGIVEVGNEITQQVTAGDVVIIPADCAQRIHNNGTDDLIFLALCTPRFVPENYVDIDSQHNDA
ncbi:MAG: Cupin 2 conserved barrel domain protein [Verrucomicrobiaceae bacterium]|nr:Cupin 2 conserved barrel domain protein [Verrucomicrobiaceae bacterium]